MLPLIIMVVVVALDKANHDPQKEGPPLQNIRKHPHKVELEEDDAPVVDDVETNDHMVM